MRKSNAKLKQLNEDNYHRTKTETENNNDYLKRLSRNAVESIRRKTKRQKEINFNKNIYTDNPRYYNKTKYTHLDKQNFFESPRGPIIDQNYNIASDERFPSLSELAHEKREKLIKLFMSNEKMIYEKKKRNDINEDSFDKYLKKYTERKNIVSTGKNYPTRNNNLGKTRTSTSVHKNIFHNTTNKEREDRVINLNSEDNNSNNKTDRNYEKNFTYNKKINKVIYV